VGGNTVFSCVITFGDVSLLGLFLSFLLSQCDWSRRPETIFGMNLTFIFSVFLFVFLLCQFACRAVGLATIVVSYSGFSNSGGNRRELLYIAGNYLITYIQLTYCLTSWTRALLEKLTVFQLVKKIPAVNGKWWFITTFTSAHHLSPS
jgi:hypothetical protein